jgi:uncharacterized protein YbjQ (UPF0145 family)
LDSNAQLNLALSLRDAGKRAEAIAALEALVENNPDSATAELAQSHLFNMRNGVEDDHAVRPDPALERILLSTAPTVAEASIRQTLGIVTAECAFGMNIFSDFVASIRDVVGGRSGTWQKALRDARQTCLYELRREAHRLGADAVVAISLSYSEISGGSTKMMFLVASGTAVRLDSGV